MIIRQFTARHGRPVFAVSTRCIRRTYANEVNINNSVHRQSERDHKPITSIRGHPDEASSILDSTEKIQTPESSSAAESIEKAHEAIQSLQAEVNAAAAAKHHGTIPPRTTSATPSSLPEAPFDSLKNMYEIRQNNRNTSKKGSVMRNVWHPWTVIDTPPTPEQITLPLLLANQTHLGHATALWNPANSSYIFGIREGIHIISLEITLAYLRRAARVVQEVARRGGIILFIGTRKGQREIVLNAAKRSKGYHIFDRWIPGSLTNGQQILGHCPVKAVGIHDDEITQYRDALRQSAHPAIRPDLVVCMNPLENEVCLHECGLYNVPTVGIIDTDTNPSWVTYPIPANDDSLRSVALIAGSLSRAGEEGQRLRMEAAKAGQATYSTNPAKKILAKVEEIASLDVQESRAESDKEVD